MRILGIPCGTCVLADGLSQSSPCGVADISLELIGLAQEEYRPEKFRDFVQCDIISTPEQLSQESGWFLQK